MARGRRWIAIVTVMIAGASATLLSATPAHADQVAVACTGSATYGFNPPLKNSLQNVAFTLTESVDCEQTLPTPVMTIVGTINSSGSVPASCNEFLFGSSSTLTRIIMWNTVEDNMSTFQYSSDVQVLLGSFVQTRTGVITAGRYDGSVAEMVTIFPNPNPLACASSGVTSVTGFTLFTIGEV